MTTSVLLGMTKWIIFTTDRCSKETLKDLCRRQVGKCSVITFDERQLLFSFLFKQVRIIRLQTSREFNSTYLSFSFHSILPFFSPLILNRLRNLYFCGPIVEQVWASDCHVGIRDAGWNTHWLIVMWLSVQKMENYCKGLRVWCHSKSTNLKLAMVLH